MDINNNKQFTLKFLADYLGAELFGNADKIITSIAPIESASSEQITFVNNPKYLKHLTVTKAGAVLISKKAQSLSTTNNLVVDDAYLAYSQLTELFVNKNMNKKIAKTAIIGAGINISANVNIADRVVIGDNVSIDDNVTIKAGVVIGDNVTIKSDTVIYPNVSIYDNVSIGKHCIIHSGVVLGADGFGFAKKIDGSWSKIHQLGTVKIGDNVEIGANTTIDCGALGDTVIHDGVKLDNQIQIGHNVEIGKNTIMAGCSAIAGSTKIGINCAIGGFSAIAGHLYICDSTMITGGSSVSSSIDKPGVYSSGAGGVVPNNIWRKNAVRYKNLDQIVRKIKIIESNVESALNLKQDELENA